MRRRSAFTALLLSLCLAAAPVRAAVFNPETYTLANGLQVVVIPNHRVPAVVQMLWYRTGSADEPLGAGGIAHFLEHLMFKGTPSVAPGELSKIVARNGGRDNAFTSYDYTAYHQTVAADRLELVMRMEADRMTNLVLTDALVDPERQVILEERGARVGTQPTAQLDEDLRAALFENHPYRRPILGWEPEMRALTRDQAIAFYRTFYAPNNAILVVAGDVKGSDVRDLAEKYYGPIAARPVPPRQRLPEPETRSDRRVVLKSSEVREPQWRRLYQAPSYRTADNRHAYPLQILAYVLGGGSTSRLYRALVAEQGLAVSAAAWYEPEAVDSGTAGVYATPRQGRTVEEVEAAVQAEVDRLLKDGVTDKEVEDARKRLAARAIFARDDLATGARVLGAGLANGRTIEEIEAWPDRIAAVTPAQVNEAARVLFSRHSVTGLLLPEAKPAATPEAPKDNRS